METQELRIGNYVCNNHSGEMIVSRIDGNSWIGLRKTTLAEGAYELHTDKVKPIPLTEEWLLKFARIEWLNKDIDGYFYWFNGEKKYIKFVHVLQNTYFCIEQKELM